MPIAVICPGCKTSFRVSDQFAGKQGPCPKCKAIITIPKSAAVEIHAPEEFTVGGKKVAGAPNFKPIARTDRKFSAPVALIIGFGAILIVAAAALLGRTDLNLFAQQRVEGIDGLGSDELFIGLGLLVISPLIAWAEYQALRDSDLEPYRGFSLVLRATICGFCYSALWAGYRFVPESFTEAVWSWMFILPPMLLVGSLVALGCFDLEFGPAFVHYALYVAICMGLAWVGGRDIIPSIIAGDGTPTAANLMDVARAAVLHA